MSRFGVLLRDFISMFPLGLEGDGFLIPVVGGGGNNVHGQRGGGMPAKKYLMKTF